MSPRTLATALVSVFGLLLAIVWQAGSWLPIPDAAEQAVSILIGAVVVALVLLVWRRSGTTLRDLGLAPGCWRAGWPAAVGFTGAGSAALLVMGAVLGSGAFETTRASWVLDYLPGIVAQQLLLQGYFAPGVFTLAAGLPESRRRLVTVATCSLAFVLLHAPNPALMIGTGLAGMFWVAHFLAHRNLLTVLLSHLVLGVVAMAALGPGPMLRLRVGPGALDLLLGR